MDKIIKQLGFISGYLMALSDQLEDNGSKETAITLESLRVDIANIIYELENINGQSDESV